MVRLVLLGITVLVLAGCVEVRADDTNAIELPSLHFEQLRHEGLEYPEQSQRVKRKIYQFEMHPHKKWTLPIKYMIDNSLRSMFVRGKSAIFLIQKVIREDFEANTCIEFKEIRTPPSGTEQFILFRKSSNEGSCTANIGRADNTATVHGQPIYLGEACFALRKALVYTIASTLGLLNEMNRPDRDQYVDFESDNVEAEDLFNFARHSDNYFTTLNLPYDFGSIMHSKPDRGLKPEVKRRNETALTLVPKNKRLLYVPGQMSEISFYDLFAINHAYCNNTCRARLFCHNGGYQDPTACGKCKCPDGYGGTYCEQIKDGSGGCVPASGKLTVKEEVRCLQSPKSYRRRQEVDRYLSGDECAWQLNAPSGKLIDMWFESLSLPYSPMSVYATCLHWVEIKYKGLGQTRGARYCQNVNRAKIKKGFISEAEVPMSDINKLTSTANEILVIFRSPDYFEPKSEEDRGFKLCYVISKHLPPRNENKPKSDMQKKDDRKHNNRILIYVGCGIGLLLIALIIIACVAVAMLVARRKKLTSRTADAGFQASTSTVVISDVEIEAAMARKKEQIEASLEGNVNPAMSDAFQIPSYKEHDPPPDYNIDPWKSEDDRTGSLENPLYENTYDVPK